MCHNSKETVQPIESIGDNIVCIPYEKVPQNADNFDEYHDDLSFIIIMMMMMMMIIIDSI